MIKYTFTNKGSALNPNIYLSYEGKERQIGSFIEMIIIMLNEYSNSNISFEGFNIIQMTKIKKMIKEYSSYIKNSDNKIKDATHIMRHRDTDFIMLDMVDAKEQLFKSISLFETIDTIESKKYGKKKMIILSGTVKRFGIMNEFGFYDIENDTLIPIETFEPGFDTYDTFECVYSKK